MKLVQLIPYLLDGTLKRTIFSDVAIEANAKGEIEFLDLFGNVFEEEYQVLTRYDLLSGKHEYKGASIDPDLYLSFPLLVALDNLAQRKIETFDCDGKTLQFDGGDHLFTTDGEAFKITRDNVTLDCPTTQGGN